MLTKQQADEKVSELLRNVFVSAEQRGISVADLARQIGMGDRRSTLDKWKNQSTQPLAGMYIVLAAWLAANPLKRKKSPTS